MTRGTLSSTPASTYSRLVSHVARYLRSEGFLRKRQAFLLGRSDGWALVVFQKSRKSTQTEILFTINLGVVSRRLMEFCEDGLGFPNIDDAHWRVRVGYLLPEKRDIWWTITPSTKYEHLLGEVESALNRSIAELKTYLNDEVLRDLWLAGISPGLTDLQRLMLLSVLVKMLGPADQLAAVLEKLRGTAQNDLERIGVAQHIRALRDFRG